MPLGDLCQEAFQAIRAHLLRSVLTLLGVIIGVGTIVGVVPVVLGLNAYVTGKVYRLAPDVFIVTKLGVLKNFDEYKAALKRRDIDWTDYKRMESSLKMAKQVAARVSSTVMVKFAGRRLADVTLWGTTANYGRLMGLDLIEGRYFVEAEDQTAQSVAIIGWDIKEELFPQMDPLGRTVLVSGAPYRVIGLVAKQGRALGQNADNLVYIPVQAYRRGFGTRASMDVVVEARGGVEGVGDAIDEARGIMRALRHTAFRAPDPFGIISVESLLSLWNQITAAAFLLSVLVAAVSLGVGGIVIMNIMLVAVSERTPEIGVRLALGARKQDIRRQFLLEAGMLSVGGGLLGVLVGVLAALGAQNILEFPAEITLGTILLGLTLSALVGLAAGYWPARSASNLLVVDALRAES